MNNRLKLNVWFELRQRQRRLRWTCCWLWVVLRRSHQLGGNGEAGAVLLGQFDFDRLGVLDRLQGSGQILRSHLQTDLVVLGGHALHLVLVEEVGLREEGRDQGHLLRSWSSQTRSWVYFLSSWKPKRRLSPVTAHTTCWRRRWPLYRTERRTGCPASAAGRTSLSALRWWWRLLVRKIRGVNREKYLISHTQTRLVLIIVYFNQISDLHFWKSWSR